MEKFKSFLKWITLSITILILSACGASNETTTPKPTPTPTSTTLPSASPTVKPSEDVDFPRRLLDLAREGKAADNEFIVGRNTIKQVRQEWGEPDKVDAVGPGMYVTYNGYASSFGYNQSNGLLFDARSYDLRLQKLTLESIVKSIGNPDKTAEIGTDDIYVYNVKQDIQLKFIIPKGANSVDHTSVFSAGSVQSVSKENYVLDIVGKSNALSSKAWTTMLDWRKRTKAFAKAHKNNVFLNGPNEKMVALTFDDGPDNQTTPAILDSLDKHKVKGSFFFIGKQVKQYPDVVKRAYENGHLVLSHSYNHVDLTKKNSDQIHSELKETEDAIKEIIGKTPAMLRTPYGETDDKVVSAAKQDGYSIVLWSIDTLDWSQKEKDNIVNNVVSNVRNGDIILMHSTKEQSETVKALPYIIEALQKDGYKIVDLETLLGIQAYK
ncbi:polysaccharide deacetylase family sporulation protein PdaB [Paenibacillaceae bacterium GAS479]|nr:polysaccharide deacetylase family sporulation protein PdaB [Paenibacillaceae bacterium GAS479]